MLGLQVFYGATEQNFLTFCLVPTLPEAKTLDFLVKPVDKERFFFAGDSRTRGLSVTRELDLGAWRVRDIFWNYVPFWFQEFFLNVDALPFGGLKFKLLKFSPKTNHLSAFFKRGTNFSTPTQPSRTLTSRPTRPSRSLRRRTCSRPCGRPSPDRKSPG